MAPMVSHAQDALSIPGAQDIAVSTDGTLLYILNKDGTVSGYNIREDSFVFKGEKIPELRGVPYQILLSSTGDRIVVLEYDPDNRMFRLSVAVYNAGTKSLEGGPAYTFNGRLESGRLSFAFSPDGTTLYMGYGADSLFRLSLTEQQQAQLRIGALPTALAVTADHTVVSVNEGAGTVSIVPDDTSAGIKEVAVGLSPTDILLNNVTGYAYISHTGSDDVYVIDPNTGSVVSIVSVGADPTDLAYDEQTGDVFVANNASGTITVIAPNFTTTTIDINSPAYFETAPIQIAYATNLKRLFILNRTEGKYIVYDTTANKIIDRRDVVMSAKSLVFSDTTSEAYILTWQGEEIIVVDVTSLEARSIRIAQNTSEVFFSSPQSIVIDSPGNRVFVSNIGANFITVLDATTFKPIEKIPSGRAIQNLFLNKKTQKLYAVSPADSTLAVIDITNDTYPQKTLQLAQQPRGGVIFEEQNILYYSNAAAGKITVIDGATDTVVGTVDVPDGSYPLVNTIDERRGMLYTALYAGGVVAVIDTATQKLVSTIPVGENPIWVRYISELDRILVTVERGEKVIVINPDTRKIAQEIPIDGKPYRIFFDPSTEFVYINHRGEEVVDVFIQDESSGEFTLAWSGVLPFWGETDRRPYNMIAYDPKTLYGYLTTRNDTVEVITIGHGENGILEGEIIATVDASGEVAYTDASREEAGANRFLAWNLFLGILVLVALGAIGAHHWMRRRESSEPASPHQ
ncbi:hypothetical protein COU17_00740 [Candidatus Kaiserbacteria bacterium CG10_big_fil_rev_8_21_14_0_10_49_17]|uniref:SMP-30/Gluconolactonase/LRE-like region domain-containing protein n=1 Tax=Candidatus Kaiserbacteria bacterium CG10_big_fil_rev_8_21_14_0_10_49_17 TaxID=1974609 RepID=A0A2M6WEY1_9BACT|nr:MAG: hypothetical protein COU17_00740 [Candidatus Kaiserbacteria bacterium CG10_big_fil_rev_8_21_14_0_10_49_17]